MPQAAPGEQVIAKAGLKLEAGQEQDLEIAVEIGLAGNEQLVPGLRADLHHQLTAASRIKLPKMSIRPGESPGLMRQPTSTLAVIDPEPPSVPPSQTMREADSAPSTCTSPAVCVKVSLMFAEEPRSISRFPVSRTLPLTVSREPPEIPILPELVISGVVTVTVPTPIPISPELTTAPASIESPEYVSIHPWFSKDARLAIMAESDSMPVHCAMVNDSVPVSPRMVPCSSTSPMPSMVYCPPDNRNSAPLSTRRVPSLASSKAPLADFSTICPAPMLIVAPNWFTKVSAPCTITVPPL